MKKISNIGRLLKTSALCSAGVAILMAGHGRAQEAAPAAADSSNENVIADIIVQARRVAENQQDVPLAVSTITQDRLQSATISSTSDIQRLVPSLQVTQNSSGYQDFIIRGSPAGFGNDAAVVTYLDEVPIEPRTLVYSLFDLSSVQELKGPQGTLFGRNSTGGAVLFFSRRPDIGEFNGYISGRYGNLDERRIEGAINLPVNDKLAFRIAGQLERRDGLVRSSAAAGYDYGNRRNEAIRISSLWKPSETVEVYTQFTRYNQKQRHMPQIITQLAGPCASLPEALGTPICFYQAPFNAFIGTQDLRALFAQEQNLPGDRTINDHPNLDYAERTGLTNAITFELGAVNIRNITYLGKNDIRFTKDFDGTPVRIFDSDNHLTSKTFYNELQFFGKALGDKLDWRVGGVYSNDRPHEVGQTFVLGQLLAGQPRNADAVQRFKSYALFGQVTAEVIPTVRATAGFRHTWDNRRLKFRIFQGTPQVCGQQDANGPFTGTDLSTCTRNLKLKFDDSNYTLTLDWKPVEKVMLYATASRGYKAGSFNLLSTRNDLTTYEPEVAENLEVGLKSDFRLGNVPFRVNLSAFRTNYNNFQASTVLVEANGNINVLTLNREPVTGTPNKARVKGIEAEVVVSPARWLTLTGFYSTISAKYKQFLIPSSTPGATPPASNDIAGTDLYGVIPKTLGLTGEVDIPLNAFAERLNATLSYYRTARPLNNTALVPNIPPRRVSLDARLGLSNLFDRGVDLAVYGKNLDNFDKCNGNAAVAGELTCSYGEPRTYGVELTFRFGGK